MNVELAYFDNAATTFPKPESVYSFADYFYRNCGGNIGRGGNALAVAAGEIALEAKNNLRMLYRCPGREVVFTSSATDALNRIILGLDIRKGEHIYISPFEHNAVTRPVNHLVKSNGAAITVLAFDSNTLTPDYEAIESAFQNSAPRLVILTHASNVCGAVIPVAKICRLAKQYGATTVVDMSQTAGLLNLELEDDSIDFAVFAGHKTLFGPFGIGGFFCRKGVELQPVFFGGNGINSVEQDMPKDIVSMVEIGSQNTYAIAGLKASTDWIIESGMVNLKIREAQILDTVLSTMRKHPIVSIIGDSMACERIGVISTTFDGYSPDEVEMLLGKFGVAVRSGIHCAPYAHSFLGTLPAGTVRFSISAMTTESDLTRLDYALTQIEESW